MTTADTITDEQIVELLDVVRMAGAADGNALCRLADVEWLDDIETACTVALNPKCGTHYTSARGRCAEILNARAKAMH